MGVIIDHKAKHEDAKYGHFSSSIKVSLNHEHLGDELGGRNGIRKLPLELELITIGCKRMALSKCKGLKRFEHAECFQLEFQRCLERAKTKL